MMIVGIGLIIIKTTKIAKLSKRSFINFIKKFIYDTATLDSKIIFLFNKDELYSLKKLISKFKYFFNKSDEILRFNSA